MSKAVSRHKCAGAAQFDLYNDIFEKIFPNYICQANMSVPLTSVFLLFIQICCGPNNEVTHAVVKYPGVVNDARIYKESTLKRIMELPGKNEKYKSFIFEKLFFLLHDERNIL
jgi:hypothetical protein